MLLIVLVGAILFPYLWISPMKYVDDIARYRCQMCPEAPQHSDE
jgi:hypothetical protein